MVDAKEFKKRIQDAIAQEYCIEFLGKEFERIAAQLTESKAEKIYRWVGAVLAKEIQPILIGSRKAYKEWRINQLLTFLLLKALF